MLIEAVKEHARFLGGDAFLVHTAHAEITVGQGEYGLCLSCELVGELWVEANSLEHPRIGREDIPGRDIAAT